MSVKTEIAITCDRCGLKSTDDNFKQYCSEVNLPSVEHFNNFGINMLKHIDGTGIFSFGIDIEINGSIDLCPECRRWINVFFEEQAEEIKILLEKEWHKNP